MGSALASSSVVRFGVFEADFCAGELRRNGVKVHLQDLPFRTLVLLLDHPNEVVSYEEIRRALWPEDVFVDFDRAIRSAVKRLRDALGDSADNPIFIQTVERHGYRWIGPIRSAEPVLQKEATGDVGSVVQSAKPPRRLLLIYAVPVLALFAVAWVLLFAYHNARSARASGAGPGKNVHNAANPVAEDFYLKGRFYWNKRTPESLNQAVDAFTQAIVHDPNYAPAYVGLADCYNLLREYSAMPANEAYSRAFAAAKKAAELDDQSSEAHASLAFVTFYGMWDAASAEREFRRAIDLDPNNAKAHHWYATFLQAIGRYRESLVEIERARELDPNSPSILADRGVLLWDAGEHADALQLLKQLERSEPDFVSPHRYLRFAYFEIRDYPGYLAEMKSEANLTHRASELAVAKAAARGFSQGGEHGLLEEQLNEQKKFYDQGALSAYWLAQTASRMGNTKEALRYLEMCFEKHDDALLMARQDPIFDNLRENPSFKQLLDRMGMTKER
jgi:DNA-binding winged helix-turn-helix (wHTH) protein/Tfp pilus assembly protein PilF